MSKRSQNPVRKTDLSHSQQVYLEIHENCGLCGTPLNFQVESHTDLPQLKEMATCPKCQITTRQKEHSVH